MLLLGLVGLVCLVIFFVSTYKVVEPNEAHLVVFMGRGKRVYSPQKDAAGKSKTAYFFVPGLMKRFVLPLTNVRMEIPNIHLNDLEMAPFVCDVISWLHISDPNQAAERLSLSRPFESLQADLVNIVQAVARAVAMKQEVLDIMKDRATFSSSVSAEVGRLLEEKWGVELVNLEVNDIRDDESKKSTVISNYESIREVQVRSSSRQQNAVKEREAIEVEQENRKKSELARVQSDEIIANREIEKEKNVNVANQKKDEEISIAQKQANITKIEAARAATVGEANVIKEATIERAKGEAEAIRVKGENEAKVVELTGTAEGKAIEAKGLAEAKSKDAMAEAMKKFDDKATVIEQIKAAVEIEKAKWAAYGKVGENANISIVNSGQGANLLGMPLNAETGADLGQMLKGLDLSKVVNMFKKPKTE